MKASSDRVERDLGGERVVVRLATAGDAGAIARYYARNDAHLSRFESPKPRAFLTAAYWRREAERRRADFRQDRTFRAFLFDGDGSLLGRANEVAGSAGLTNILRGVFSAAYLGYSLDERLQGRGLMHEGLSLLIDHAFSALALHRIMANYDPANERSAHVLRRLGFRVEGYATDYLFINGTWHDHVLTALVNERWRTPRGLLRMDAAGRIEEVPPGCVPERG